MWLWLCYKRLLPPALRFNLKNKTTSQPPESHLLLLLIVAVITVDMKIQCDVCEKAPATIICCADEAALCAACDVQVHAANKLASKHQRLLLQSLSNKLPQCDICQEKTAFIFCVEDRALFCQDCDESIHVEGSLSANHQRLLATGIRVALASVCSTKAPAKNSTEPSNMPSDYGQQTPQVFSPSSWAVDEFFQLSDYECGDKRGSPIGFGELELLADIGLFQQQTPDYTLSAAEVPELSYTPVSSNTFFKPPKSNTILKKPRIEISDDDDGFFIVPDLG